MTTEDSTANAPGLPPPAVARPPRSLRSRLPEETGVIVAIVALIIFIGAANPLFLQPKSLFQLLSSSAFTGMLAVGMVFVIVIRDIDLSIGWMFNFSAVIAGKLMILGVEPVIAALAGRGHQRPLLLDRRSASTTHRELG